MATKVAAKKIAVKKAALAKKKDMIAKLYAAGASVVKIAKKVKLSESGVRFHLK